ncbi:ATP-dependent helicase [Actinosynnema pretiosum]|uniref:DNA 3'-5' helicase n=1 Tax=Actinosynnema pretiosum TaxID=42197 RepID=A0A290Z0S5_9PSEU|nr:UvrD-helicase domain-containing protein [Actinosynnema pretiosum]ATE52585.1 ATP-dependent DNA helicase [Actinosynnema pretiosum]
MPHVVAAGGVQRGGAVPHASPADIADALGLHPPTPEQAAVIASPAAPALVVAGAGAGKTETMAARVVYLVANGVVTPDRVLGLTFTRKAARQLGERVRGRLRRLAGSPLLDRLDPSGRRRAAVLTTEPVVLTYHAYAGRLVSEHGLRLPVEPGVRLLTETAAWQLAHRVVSAWTQDLDTDKIPTTITSYLLSLAGELGEHLVEPEQLLAHAEHLCALIEHAPKAPRQKDALPEKLQEIVDAQRLRVALLPLLDAYRARKRRDAVLDFADQMSLAARLATGHPEVVEGERERYGAVLLDEYQDTGHAQRVLLRALFGDGDPMPVTSVGDPAQAIYGWRGASAANLPRFREDFPPADKYELLTSFRNPPEVLHLANAVSGPLRAAGLDVAPLRARDGVEPGDVRIGLFPDVRAELEWLADTVAEQWRAHVDTSDEPPTAAVLVRRRSDMPAIAAVLRDRGLPVEVVGLGGLLDEPEVRDLTSALRVLVDPLAGTAATRLLTGSRWRIAAFDLAAMWQRARDLAGAPARKSPDDDPLSVLADALPGEHSEQAGLADALDDPGDPSAYSAEGYRRIRRLGAELAALRRRLTQPLPELVADVERTLLLDIEAVARPGGVGRAHLDAFADVVSDFAAASPAATLPALLDYLRTAEHAEDGLAPGEVEVVDNRVQLVTMHSAKGLEWRIVAVPHVVKDVFPGRRKSASWLKSVTELPAALRGDAQDLPELRVPGGANRKEVEEALDRHADEFEERRLVEERRLLYVALTRSEHSLLVSGHWWGETGASPKGPSAFLTELREVVAGAEHPPADVVTWAPAPGLEDENPLAAQAKTAQWPADPLGSRRDAVSEGAAMVVAALDRLREAAEHEPPGGTDEPAAAEPETGTADAGEAGEEWVPPDDEWLPSDEEEPPPPPEEPDGDWGEWTTPDEPWDDGAPLDAPEAGKADTAGATEVVDAPEAAAPEGSAPETTEPETAAPGAATPAPGPGAGAISAARLSAGGGVSAVLPDAETTTLATDTATPSGFAPEGDSVSPEEADLPEEPSTPTAPVPATPETTDPAPADPESSDPAPADPRVSTPVPTDPRVSASIPTDPRVSASIPTDPEIGAPVPTDPQTSDPDAADPEGWARDVDVLLAERAAAMDRRERVLLPEHLSVSQLVELATDPDQLARRLRRPLPFPPNPLARRGTAFHTWLERRFGAVRLLELDELPGAADEDAVPDGELGRLQEAFLASAWADRTPHAVEVPFEAEVDGLAVRGRMDAVFADPDGGWTVVDWKTGRVPEADRVPSLSVQLAAYRLAWASLSGSPVELVRAAFHYVRDDRTLRPADLLDAEGLRALIRTVPDLRPKE